MLSRVRKVGLIRAFSISCSDAARPEDPGSVPGLTANTGNIKRRKGLCKEFNAPSLPCQTPPLSLVKFGFR